MDENMLRARGSMGFPLVTREDLAARDKRMCESTWIVVTGYDTALSAADVEIALWKHFSVCGEIAFITLHKEYGPYGCSDDRPLCGTCIIGIAGDVAEEKVMALSGKETQGGWTVVVVSVTPPRVEVINKVVTTSATISGFDTSLITESKVKNALKQHFSSCGDVTQVTLFTRVRSRAIAEISGEDATAEKIMQLNGSFMGGFQISVQAIAPLTTGFVRYSRPAPPLSVLLADPSFKATMVKSEKKKTTMVKSEKKKKKKKKKKKTFIMVVKSMMKKKKKKKTMVKSSNEKECTQ